MCAANREAMQHFFLSFAVVARNAMGVALGKRHASSETSEDARE